ncbi:MAG: hypothetical protein AAGC92_07220 [Pseudomonadota bacterium]
MRYLIAACLAPLIALAAPALTQEAAPEQCAPGPDRTAERMALLDRLAAAPTPMAAQQAAGLVWQFWMTAPDATAQALLDDGVRSIRYADYAKAETVLDDLVAYCPDFAEGWNQRAFARFLRGRYFESLADIEEVLAREPAHFGALSGKVQILVIQDRARAARGVLRETLKSHPWMVGQGLLPDPDPASDPARAPGDDI